MQGCMHGIPSCAAIVTPISRVSLSRMQGCAAAELFEGLLMLQHRGQDSAGMVTYDGTRFCEHKENGLVNDVFQPRDMTALRGAPKEAEACC
jgi:amidophosphoribosyltransferase